MFDKFKKNNGNANCSQEEQLANTEKMLSTQKRIMAVNSELQALSASQPMNLDTIMNMLGTLGSDGSINQSIIDNMAQMFGNNPDPIAMTKYFSGLIAQRVLTVADVRKVPGSIFAYKGGIPLDITSDQVYVQPVHLFGASSLIQPARFKQQPLSIAFDANGQINIGNVLFSNYTSNTGGSYTAPFVAHLIVVKRNDTSLGDAKIFMTSEFGYEAGLQLTADTAAILMINHTKAIKVVSSSDNNVAAPPDLVVNLNFDASDLDDQFEIDTASPMEVVVTGTNVSLTHYQLPMYTPIAEAILASLISGRLDMLPTWMLNNLSKEFKF